MMDNSPTFESVYSLNRQTRWCRHFHDAFSRLKESELSGFKCWPLTPTPTAFPVSFFSHSALRLLFTRHFSFYVNVTVSYFTEKRKWSPLDVNILKLLSSQNDMPLSPCFPWSHTWTCLSSWLRGISLMWTRNSTHWCPCRDLVPLVITLSSPLCPTCGAVIARVYADSFLSVFIFSYLRQR